MPKNVIKYSPSAGLSP